MNEYHPGKNELEAMRREAEAGDALAQYQLATFLETGFMEDQNPDPFHWYMKAALGGHAESMWNAGLQLVEGVVVERDVKAGLHLIQLAAKNGCLGASRFLRDINHLELRSEDPMGPE